MPNKNTSRYIPLIVALCLIAGIVIGHFYTSHFSDNRMSFINTSSNKLNDLLHIINDEYVDTVKIPDLVEKSIPKILTELDPHSTYATAKNVENEMQSLKGSFSGIGVIFTILDDTARVIRVLEDGPSADVGIKAGDRIVKLDGENFTGKTITNDYAMSHLKGPKDSKVTLGITRRGVADTLQYTIVRGNIPVKSLDLAYMLDDKTGYICINSFGDTTYPEFLAALAKLNHEGFQNLIIDLRSNHGGYMAPSIQMANEFLPKNRLIVYTEGRKSPRAEYKSDGRGSYQSIPLVVLVDENSASASEIFSAAIQDNDRGSIVGRRTFGKGLVQEPVNFSDGSMLRLTIARYYSASGRCLQKPYVMGKDDNYNMDLLNRAEKGEYFSKDSIHFSGEQYKTSIGRTVYGGGGVMPDYFIPADTIGITSYFQEALYKGLLAQYAYHYVDNNRQKLQQFNDWNDVVKYLKKQNLPEQFATFAEKRQLKRRNIMLNKSLQLFEDFLTAYILDDLMGNETKIMYTNLSDECVRKAKEIFKKEIAWPQNDTTAVKK